VVVTAAKAKKLKNLPRIRRFETEPSRRIPAKIPPELIVHGRSGLSLAPCGAVVRIVSVVDPVPVTEVGLKLQLLSAGKPVHEELLKSIVLAYPAWPVMVNVTVPEPPLFTISDPLLAEKLKSACTLTLIAGLIDMM